MTEHHVREHEARRRLCLDSIRLSKRNFLSGKVRTIGLENVAIQSAAVGCRCTIDGHHVVVNVQTRVDNHTAIGCDEVARCVVAASIGAVPVHLVAQAIKARLHIGRNCE